MVHPALGLGCVSGEWDGVTATFYPCGQALELPEHYVPSAFREWDVHLFDWQTQCSSQASRDDGLRVALKRLMPTVGCEADAVAFTEEAQHGLQPQSELPITPSGSYVLAPASMEAKDLRLEVCMARPSSGPLAPRLRTRVVFSLRRKQSDGSWELQDIQVHNEKWVSPYNGGAELAGCGGGERTFAKRPALERSLLKAALDSAVEASAQVHLQRGTADSSLHERSDSMPASRLKEVMEDALLLPSGIAASVAISRDSVQVASGLVSDDDDGSLLGAAMCSFSTSGLDEVIIM
ncbi:g7722 [Coccomyxa viridis]|uniref:G7722 protein n=1 Tax=Coccomyxa viridis TaxID=1274662 RepID=A0ABP1G565_9CHLO